MGFFPVDLRNNGNHIYNERSDIVFEGFPVGALHVYRETV